MEDRKLIAHPDVTVTELEDEGVVLNLETKTYYTLNKPGMYVWHLIKDGIVLSEIVKRVQSEFSVEREIAEKNVYDLVDELIRERLVRVTE